MTHTPKHIKRHGKQRRAIGIVLSERGSMTAREVADILSDNRSTRRYLNNSKNVANLLKGAIGIKVTDDHPRIYSMINFDSYLSWLGFTDELTPTGRRKDTYKKIEVKK
jgi:hypothetical protein|tara:strand:- start:370 stop:696 length:327 start_codon:yes stop_codon:yes gene_type:complete